MSKMTTGFAGRAVDALPEGDTRLPEIGKWALVDALTKAAPDYGLSHRSIAVLRAMLSFVPDKSLPTRFGVAVVFASNATLSERLGGMPESTLRRHLAHLVNAGVIARHDSPNRKRFARRIAGGLACAYGFDLAPLALQAGEIGRLAALRQQRAEERAALHSAVLEARQRLCVRIAATGTDPDGIHAHSPLLARTRLILRHKDNNEALAELLDGFETALTSLEMNGCDIENERHYKKEYIKISDTAEATVSHKAPSAGKLSADNFAVKRISEVTSRCTEYRKLFPEPAQSWNDLSRQAAQLVPMLGIEAPVYDEAKAIMGPYPAAIAVLVILERFDQIKSAGAYLRSLSKQARTGSLNIQALLATCGEIVS